jgi:hypothetical protein
MSTLLYALDRGEVPTDQATVRRTADPVDHGTPAAVQPHEPEWNEKDSDPNPDLGMTERNLASHYIPGVKYKPGWADNATAEHNAIINRQVATSGTAAARELAGEQGHGSMPVTIGIEPTIRDGSSLGNDYFAVDDRTIQEGSGSYMQPSAYDRDNVIMAGSTGKANARDAASSGQYATWFRAMQNGAL